jgi:hypothetical protein
MSKQTAVEWLVEQVNSDCLNSVFIRPDLIKHAKEMEKEQMNRVSLDWFIEGSSHMKDNKRIYQSFEQYYTETFTEQPKK